MLCSVQNILKQLLFHILSVSFKIQISTRAPINQNDDFYLVNFIWGGTSVGSLTLERFFLIHYLMPSFLVLVIILHINSLHKLGSSNPLKLSKLVDVNYIQLYPYYILKDLFAILVVLGLCCYLIFFHPDFFDNLVNNISANSQITPKHIVPEWYFLSFYVVLKLILVKWVGILIMILFIGFPICLPILNK